MVKQNCSKGFVARGKKLTAESNLNYGGLFLASLHSHSQPFLVIPCLAAGQGLAFSFPSSSQNDFGTVTSCALNTEHGGKTDGLGVVLRGQRNSVCN